MKKLSHRQQVKFAGCKWVDLITVHTLKGCCGNNQEDYQKSLQKGEEEAWSFKSPYCLTSNYLGKDLAIQRQKESFEEAPMLEDGEQVEIEGSIYIVKINGLRFSDPIKFIKQ